MCLALFFAGQSEHYPQSVIIACAVRVSFHDSLPLLSREKWHYLINDYHLYNSSYSSPDYLLLLNRTLTNCYVLYFMTRWLKGFPRPPAFVLVVICPLFCFCFRVYMLRAGEVGEGRVYPVSIAWIGRHPVARHHMLSGFFKVVWFANKARVAQDLTFLSNFSNIQRICALFFKSVFCEYCWLLTFDSEWDQYQKCTVHAREKKLIRMFEGASFFNYEIEGKVKIKKG